MAPRAQLLRGIEEIGRFVYGRYKAAAHRAVYSAVREGRIVPAHSLRCEDCGQQAEVYDHRRYDLPMLVAAVCVGCNVRRGSASIDMDRIRLDLSCFWGDGDLEKRAKLLGFTLAEDDEEAVEAR